MFSQRQPPPSSSTPALPTTQGTSVSLLTQFQDFSSSSDDDSENESESDDRSDFEEEEEEEAVVVGQSVKMKTQKKQAKTKIKTKTKTKKNRQGKAATAAGVAVGGMTTMRRCCVVELASKVVDDEQRLQETLLHEVVCLLA